MRRFAFPLSALITLLALTTWTGPAAAAWPHAVDVNVPLCTAANDQQAPVLVADGAGGSIVAWQDKRVDGNGHTYAQRLSAAGTPLWTADGVALGTAGGSFGQVMIPDGTGGAIVAWGDFRSFSTDIYVQRVNAAGVPQWTADGVPVCTAANDQYSLGIASDGAGGAIITWVDLRAGFIDSDIYAQSVNAGGVPQWTADGVVVCAAANNQNAPSIVPDGTGGAVITWSDERASFTPDIYAQRLDATGAPQWTPNGEVVCNDPGQQSNPKSASDGAGGAIVTWSDYRGASGDIYVQRMAFYGYPYWTSNGVALCAAANEEYYATPVPDGAGGAIVAWRDSRNLYYDIYARRVNAAGVPQWTPDGVAVCTAAGDQNLPAITPDGTGGAFIAWGDYRSGGSTDIYAQRISATGALYWEADGVALSAAPNEQQNPCLVADGAGGMIAAWMDVRSATSADIYAQNIERFGKRGDPEPAIVSVLDIPNDQGGKVKLSWSASYLDLETDPDLSAYDLFRSVPPNLAEEAISAGSSRRLSLGEVPVAEERAHLFTGDGIQELAWEYVSSVNAFHFIATYGSTQVTTGDSIAGSNPTTAFMVVGRNTTGSKYWLSETAYGYSVDNLAPAAPGPFTGEYGGGAAHLHWDPNTEADLAGYRLYRGTTTGFVPGPGNLVASLPDTGHTDVTGTLYVYKLTAIDSHGNQSPPVTLVLNSTVGVDETGPAALAFAAPSPNPAFGSATLNYTLSRPGHVRLAVYDVTGRCVRVLRDGEQEGGAHRETFALRDDSGRSLPGGLYQLQLAAEGRVLTRKLVLVR